MRRKGFCYAVLAVILLGIVVFIISLNTEKPKLSALSDKAIMRYLNREDVYRVDEMPMDFIREMIIYFEEDINFPPGISAPTTALTCEEIRQAVKKYYGIKP